MATYVNLAVEDSLSEAVLRRIIEQSRQQYAIGFCYCGGGYIYLKQKIPGFNNAAKGTPFIVLADLEAECPPSQIRSWLPVDRQPNLMFRIAVREIESWLLADRTGFAAFLGISKSLLPRNADEINDPKQRLIGLAKRSRKRARREAIVPSPNSTAKIGRGYNGELASFVRDAWNIEEAMKNSDSLRRTVNAIGKFQPIEVE